MHSRPLWEPLWFDHPRGYPLFWIEYWARTERIYRLMVSSDLPVWVLPHRQWNQPPLNPGGGPQRAEPPVLGDSVWELSCQSQEPFPKPFPPLRRPADLSRPGPGPRPLRLDFKALQPLNPGGGGRRGPNRLSWAILWPVGELVRKADTAAFIQCHVNAFEYLGGVPRRRYLAKAATAGHWGSPTSATSSGATWRTAWGFLANSDR